jgi:hypothetical protein
MHRHQERGDDTSGAEQSPEEWIVGARHSYLTNAKLEMKNAKVNDTKSVHVYRVASHQLA